MGHKHEYWVVFPQGIEFFPSWEAMQEGKAHAWTKMLTYHSVRDAEMAMTKFNGAYYEKVVGEVPHRVAKYIYTRPEDNELSKSELWDKYETFPHIKIIGDLGDLPPIQHEI